MLTRIGIALIYSTSLKNTPLCDNCQAPCHSLPLFAWLQQKGVCRICKQSLSLSYITVPLISASAFAILMHSMPPHYLAAYSFFFSALIITLFTDIQYMLISRFVTVYLLPIPLALSTIGYLPITPHQVMFGALSGYLILSLISYIFAHFMQKQGMGQGDIDLLSFIGAFLGFGGWWISLLIASCIGSVIGMLYLLVTKQGKQTKIPFGPFLALGAMIYTIWGNQLFAMLFPPL